MANNQKIVLPNKKYSVIYADPPYEYGSITKLGNARNYYKTLTFKELSEIRIQQIAEKNCLLFLWGIGQKLNKCISLGESWGFKYVNVGFVWFKPNRVLCGYYTMSQTELCLIFKKGKIPQPRGARNIREFIKENATIHSKKPDEARRRISQMFPHQSKIELFARNIKNGWDSWGDELNGQ